MSTNEVLDLISMEPTYLGEPTPDVLLGFQIRVLPTEEEGFVKLSVDFFTNSLLVSPKIPADQADICIESMLVGLRFGHSAAGYKKIGDTWVGSNQRSNS